MSRENTTIGDSNQNSFKNPIEKFIPQLLASGGLQIRRLKPYY
jgi:hypothetical protein